MKQSFFAVDDDTYRTTKQASFRTLSKKVLWSHLDNLKVQISFVNPYI